MSENPQNSAKKWPLPRGFLAGGICSGIKSREKKDLGLIVSQPQALTFGAFTQNPFRAVSVDYDESELQRSNQISHVVVNSGNANACTGARGESDNREIVNLIRKHGENVQGVLVSSTGVIGRFLPMEKIRENMPRLQPSLQRQEGHDFAEAILTTDTVTKTFYREVQTADGVVRVSGVAKGAGMICPNMATMLAYVLTDVQLPESYGEKFQRYLAKSFNSISVDGDTSTNDMVLLMANGASEVSYADLNAGDRDKIDEALEDAFVELAKQIARDGEGATKLVTFHVVDARDESQAKQVGKNLSNSPLIKTALFGCDPNWGRIIVTVGGHHPEVEPSRVSVSFCGQTVFSKGQPVPFEQEKLKAKMAENELEVIVSLGSGSARWTCWTCDLTYDYVKINAEYTT